MSTEKLGISRVRRVTGATLNLAVGVCGVRIIVMPGSIAHPLLWPLTNRQTGCALLLIAVYLASYILYPCCLDEFPTWLRRRYGDERMKRMARGIFGVGISVVGRPERWVPPVWVRSACVMMLALILLGNLAIITFTAAHRDAAFAIVALLWILSLVALFLLRRLWLATISARRQS